jgi:hypothetical protein
LIQRKELAAPMATMPIDRQGEVRLPGRTPHCIVGFEALC